MRLARLLIVFCALFGATAASASAASMSIGFSADPTEDRPVSVTVSGTSDAGRSLFVVWTAGSACAATYAGNAGGVSLTSSYYGEPVAAGPYARTYTMTPSAPSTYRLCGYLASSRNGPNDASADETFSARGAHASAAIAFSADPTEDMPVAVTVSGSTEVARSLWVLRTTAAACAATYDQNPDGEGLSPSYYGDPIGAGPYSRTYTFTPAIATTHRICAYLGQSRSGPDDATAARDLTVRPPRAGLSIAVPRAVRIGDRAGVAVTGSTEVGRRLWVGASRSGCAPTYAANASLTALTSFSGDALGAGPFTHGSTFTPDAAGPWWICAYVGESRDRRPDAAASAEVAVAAPVTLAVDVPASVRHDQRVPIALRGFTNKPTVLWAYVLAGTPPCPATRTDAAKSSTAVVGGVVQPPGEIAAPASFGPSSPGSYRVCAYATPQGSSFSAGNDATAQGAFVIEEDPAFLVVLASDDDHEDRDRLTLRWRRGPADGADTLRVYDRPPAPGVQPLLDAGEGSTDLELTTSGDLRIARVRRHLGYRRLWWNVRRTAPRGRSSTSATQSVRVVPRPLSRAAAKARAVRRLGSSSRKPGSVRLSVVSSPLAKVVVQVRRRGRTVARRAWTETVAGARSLTFALSCARTGTFRYIVSIRDPYGTRVSRTGAWSLPRSRCAALRRREAARRVAAERERQAAARRERQRSTGGGSSGGDPSSGGGGSSGGGSADCDGDPNATPYPQHAGQRDGDGDGCYGET